MAITIPFDSDEDIQLYFWDAERVDSSDLDKFTKALWEGDYISMCSFGDSLVCTLDEIVKSVWVYVSTNSYRSTKFYETGLVKFCETMLNRNVELVEVMTAIEWLEGIGLLQSFYFGRLGCFDINIQCLYSPNVKYWVYRK